MTTVNDLLRMKGHQVWTISPDASVYDALVLMADKNVGALVVTDPGGHVAGIFSERDYARKVILLGRTSHETAVREIMTSPVVTVTPDESVTRCMTLMTQGHFRHLPVVGGDGELGGLISIGDAVKSIMSEQQMLIQHLESYITS